MKHLIMATSIATVAMLCITLPSCSNDDNKDVIEANTSKAEAKKFIGEWSGYGYWIFREDGTCEYTYNNTFTGHWTYNSETKTLITDVLQWNWQILNLSNESWTGTHLGGSGHTYTYKRVK